MFDARVQADQKLRQTLIDLYEDRQFDGEDEVQVRSLLEATRYLGSLAVSQRISGRMGQSWSSVRERALEHRHRTEMERWVKPFGPNPYLQSAPEAG